MNFWHPDCYPSFVAPSFIGGDFAATLNVDATKDKTLINNEGRMDYEAGSIGFSNGNVFLWIGFWCIA
jgi:hypothetical protein